MTLSDKFIARTETAGAVLSNRRRVPVVNDELHELVL